METKKFVPTEIAYQLPNRRQGYALGEMKVSVVKSQAAMEKKLADIADKGGEVYGVRDAVS